MSIKAMRRFGIASVVLGLIGALFTFFGAPDGGKQLATAHTEVSKPAKKIFARRRNRRALMVLAERTGEAAVTTHRAVFRVAAIGQPRAAVATPVAKAPAGAPNKTSQFLPSEQQTAPARVEKPGSAQTQSQAPAPEAERPDYLPPSARQKADVSGGNEAKPAPKQKASPRQAGTRIIYRTQQTSGRGQGQRRDYRYGYPSWGW